MKYARRPKCPINNKRKVFFDLQVFLRNTRTFNVKIIFAIFPMYLRLSIFYHRSSKYFYRKLFYAYIIS